MDIIGLIGSAWPADNFWATLIQLFDVGNYAWTIILFTLVLKLVFSPLDFLQRFYTNKTMRAQAKLQPQIEKLQRQYGQNQNLLYQKQNELYKKSGFSMKGSCIVMIVYLVVTLVVFLTLYTSIQYIAGFKIKNQFNDLQATYTQNYETEYFSYLGVDLDEYNALETQEEKDNYILALEEEIGNQEEVEINKEQAISNAQSAVVDRYLEIKDSWLWIKNIWIADKATSTEILQYDSYISLTGDNSVSEEDYNLVIQKLLNGEKGTNGVNGYYILSILVVAVSFLSQFISRKVSQPKNINTEQQKQPAMTKIMMFLLPIIMLIFTLNSSAIFSIYILVNSLISTALIPIISLICNAIENKNEKKKQEQNRVDYRRY